MRIVITGFEPFGGRERNLSWDVAARVASHGCPAGPVKAVMLPVSFSRVIVAVSDMLRDMRSDAVLMLGLPQSGKGYRLRGWPSICRTRVSRTTTEPCR